MENKNRLKILSPRQAEIRRTSGNSIEAAVSGVSGMYEAFQKSIKKAKETVSGALSKVIEKVFPPAQISIIDRESPRLYQQLPPLFDSNKNNIMPLPIPKPMHSDSGTMAPTPGRFEKNEEANEFEPPNKKIKVENSGVALEFKPNKPKNCMATPIWKKYQFKPHEKYDGIMDKGKNSEKNEQKSENKEKILEKNEDSKKKNEVQSKNSEEKVKKIEVFIGKLNENKEEIERNKEKFSEKEEEKTNIEKNKTNTDPDCDEKKLNLTERDYFKQHLKNYYVSKNNSEEKKLPPDSSSKNSEKDVKISESQKKTNGANSTPIGIPSKLEVTQVRNPFEENSSKSSLKKLEQTPEFGKNPDKSIDTSKISKKSIDFFTPDTDSPNNKKNEKNEEKDKIVSFFVQNNEKHNIEMDEGFVKNSKNSSPVSKNPSEAGDDILRPEDANSIKTEHNSQKGLEKPAEILPNFGTKSENFMKKDENLGKQAEIISKVPGSRSPVQIQPSIPSNPFLSSSSVNQVKPVYVFGSNPGPNNSAPSSIAPNPFANPIPNPNYSNPMNIVYNPQSNPNPFATTVPVSSNFGNAQSLPPNSAVPQQNPFSSANFPSTSYSNASNTQNNPFSTNNNPTSNPYLPNNTISNPFSNNPPNQFSSTPINNPFNSNAANQISSPFNSNSGNTVSNPFNPVSSNQFNSSNPISNPFASSNQVSNPFSTSSNPISNPFSSSSNGMNSNPNNYMNSSNQPPINPRPNLYGSTFSGRDVEMGAEVTHNYNNNSNNNVGSFNLGSIPPRNIIKGRRPK